MAVESSTDALLRTLVDEVRSLRNEFKETYVTKESGPYVRASDHQAAIQLLAESHNKDVQLITQAHTAGMEAVGARLKAIDDPEKGSVAVTNQRIDKYDNKANWLNNLVYGLLIMALLALLIGNGASRGLFGQ